SNELRVTTDEYTVPDFGLIFFMIDSIVTSDCPAADVHISPDFGISKISEMSRLRFGSELHFLHLNEISDLGLFADFSLGTQTRVRTNSRAVRNFDFLEITAGFDLNSIPDFRIDNKAIRFNRSERADFGEPTNHDVGINHRTRADLHGR